MSCSVKSKTFKNTYLILLLMEGFEEPTKWRKFKEFVLECRRVFRITKRPSGIEFKTIVKVSALGMILIGLVGFLVHLIDAMLFG